MAAAAFAYRSNKNSSSDSDSDEECRDWKRASGRMSATDNLEKIPIDPPVVSSNPTPSDNSVFPGVKRKRNRIWSDVLEDQMISETLNHCGIKSKPKGYGSRGEESYDYTLSYKYQKKGSDSDDQMSEDDTPEKNSEGSKTDHQSCKTLNKKFVKLDSAEKNAARKIVKILGEPKQYLIYRVVKYIGIEKAMELLKMTEDIEENGGLLIKNQQRRRTPGGVYFQLLKGDKHIEKATVDKIFEGEMSTYDRKKMFEEKKKNRKLKAQKNALLKKLSLEMNNCQELSVESQMDEDSMVVEEVAMEKDSIPQEENAKTSDLEDGEIAD